MQHITLHILYSLLIIGLSPTQEIDTAEQQSQVAPEICDNGIDDDGDGLVDIQDDDCECNSRSLDYIPNPSFEQYSDCPNSYSQMYQCEYWVQPGWGTPDFYHECGFLGIFNEVVQPLPDGDGCVAFSNSPTTNIGYKEYVGVCLNNALSENKGYRLNFSLGFKDAANSPPTTFSMFGSSSCEALNNYDSDSEQCPTTQAEWIEIASMDVNGAPNEWTRFSLDIYPDQDINTIVLGGNCEIMTIGEDNYYFLDDLQLYEIFMIQGENGQQTSEPYIRVASGHPCTGDLVLETHANSTLNYQWYRNGVAIAGATGASYGVPSGDTGDYQVRVGDGELCATSAIYEVRIDSYTTRIERTLCEGESLTYQDSVFSSEGIHSYLLTSSDGCDSVIEFDLTYTNPDEVSIDRTICEGEGFTLGPNVYTQSGIYEDTLSNSFGCDSIVQLTLEVREHKQATLQQTICEGDRYYFDGQWLAQTGVYTDTLTSESGCDSVVSLDLEVSEASQSHAQEVICYGESYPFNDQLLNSSGTYRDTLTGSSGCDSIIILDLEVQDGSIHQVNASICEGTYYEFNGRILQKAGTYEKVYQTKYGCDSIVQLDLNVYSNSVYLGGDRSVPLGESILIAPEFEHSNIEEWTWNQAPGMDPVCSDCPELEFNPKQSGWIEINATDDNGCTLSDRINIQVTNKTKGLYIPNAFSPNGDGVNDFYRPYPSDKIQSIERMTIFNRNGQVVFERSPLNLSDQSGWQGDFNGKKAMPGVYIYIIEVKYIDGTSRQFKGDLTLIR